MNMLFSSSEHSLQEKSLYAQKRDKKMNSHSVNTTFSGTDDLNEKSEPILAQHPVLLPRYVNPLSMVKSKTKNEIAAPANSSLELMTAANPTPAVPTPSAAVEKHTAQVVSVPESSRVGNKQHLLGGNGVVFRADSHEPAKSTSSTSNNDKAVLEPSVPVSVPMAKKIKIPVPPKKLLKTVGQAISDWNMIEDGDRVVLGLSGGKDSLCMLHLLRHFQRIAPIRFTLACATVDPQTDSFDPSPLIPYVQSLGITYHYLSEPIVAMAKEKMQGDSLCAFCARFKRGLLYSCCRDNNYNKLVLAQHLDDLAESFMMSALHNGQVRTMKANYPIDNADDDIRVIRPLVYTREQSTRDFSLSLQLPVINENCPACFEEPKERARMKKLLSQEEIMIPSLFQNMRRALTPLMHGDTYKVMHKVVEDIEALNASKSNGKVRKQKRSDDSTEQVVKGETNVDETGGAKKRSRPHTAGDEEGEDSSISKVQCTDEYCAPCYELA
jgi:tRNA(Ile)-lysidine synthase TilS/MesJ